MASSKTVKPAAVVSKPWRPNWLTLPFFEAASTSLRTVLINAALLVLMILIIPLIGAQFARDQVLLQPISIPSALLATGLTPEVAANRLWDGLQQIEGDAGTAKTSVNVIPEGQKVTFSIPDAGVSVDSLVYYARQFFNLHEVVVNGEFRCADKECTPAGVTLRLRVYGKELKVIELPPMRRDTEAQYWRKAATEVMAVLDPFTALAADATAHPNNAAAIATRLIVSHHKDAKWAHNILGNIRHNAGQPADAMAEYQAALDLDPNFVQALGNMAGINAEQGNYAEATKWMDRLAAVDSTGPLERELRGDVARVQGKLDDAKAFYQTAFERDPLNSRYQSKAALMLMNAGRTDEGIALAKEALQINPADTVPLSILAAYYMGKGDSGYADAERLYRDAADFAPEDAEIQATDAGILLLTHDYTTALQRIDQALLNDDGNVGYRIVRADALGLLGRHQDALIDLDLAYQRDPSNPNVSYKRGDNLASLKRYDEAVAAYKLYLTLAPEGGYAGIVPLLIAQVEKQRAAETAPAPETAAPAATTAPATTPAAPP